MEGVWGREGAVNSAVEEEAGVQVVAGPEQHENGAFAWILDLDGNKVELWQPKAWDPERRPG